MLDSKPNRRGILKLLGLAPVAAPLAAKAAADTQIAKLSGVALEGGAPGIVYAGCGPPTTRGAGDYAKITQGAADYANLVGIPDFIKERMRRSASFVGVLDPDIAAKKSWSMSVKILTQRQRNYERAVEALQYQAWQSRAGSAFKTVTGWDWPW